MAQPTLTRVVRRLRTAAGPQMDASATDRELLDSYVRGKDEAAFAELVRRHERTVLGACRHILIDPADIADAFQATFLVLVEKARRIKWHSSLGGWLFAVAHRIAVCTRKKSRKRREKEGRVAKTDSGTNPPDPSWREACDVLHDELDRLSDTYRLPLLLCYLEGLSRDEAAKRLGWTLDTVRGRLERGREKLRSNLARRGITLSAGLLGALAGNSTAAGGPVPQLIELTVCTASNPSAAIAALAHGASPMFAAGKTSIAIVLLIGLMGLGAGFRQPHVGAEEEPAAKNTEPAAQKPKPEKPKSQPKGPVARGRVYAPDGEPLPKARLYLLRDDESLAELGTTNAEGRFDVLLPKGWRSGHLVAQAAAVGVDFIALDDLSLKKDLELKTVVDQPIRGRIIDTEGKPVAGASVRVNRIGAFSGNSIDPLLTEWKKLTSFSGSPSGDKQIWGGAGALFSATTDKDGSFEFHGIGAERLATLRISGAGFTVSEAYVATRKGLDPKPYNEATASHGAGRRWLLHGPDVSIVAEREKLIRGRVTEAATGKPRASVTVTLSRTPSDLLAIPLSTQTDKDGNYVIRGARKATGYMVEVASDASAALMACQGHHADTPGYDPITINLEMKKGIIITGRIIDVSTGEAIPGYAMASVLQDNPFVKDYPEFDSSAWFRVHKSDKDGTFRVVTIPGPVVLMHVPNSGAELAKYKRAAPDPKYPKYFSKEMDGYAIFYGTGGLMMPLQGNFAKVLEIKPDDKEVHQDILLEPAKALPVQLRDGDGKSVTTAWVAGYAAKSWLHAIQPEAGTCSAFDLKPGEPRLVVAVDPKRKLAGVLHLKGAEKEAVTLKLGAAAALKGRLVDKDGRPLAGVRVEVRYVDRAAFELHEQLCAKTQVVSARDGTFRADGLLPGLKFRIVFHAPTKQMMSEDSERQYDAEGGKDRDLGDIYVTPKAE